MSQVTETKSGGRPAYKVTFDQPVQGQMGAVMLQKTYENFIEVKEANPQSFNLAVPKGTVTREMFKAITAYLADGPEEDAPRPMAGRAALLPQALANRSAPMEHHSYVHSFDFTSSAGAEVVRDIRLSWPAKIIDVIITTTVTGSDVGVRSVSQRSINLIGTDGSGRGLPLEAFGASSLLRGHLRGQELNNVDAQTWTVRHGAAGTTTVAFILDRGPGGSCSI